MNILPLTDTNRIAVDRFIKEEWGGPMIVTLGNLYDSSVLPGFIALENEQAVGAILYRMDGSECEIVVLYSLLENHGIGSALIHKVIDTAKAHDCRRVWLVTSNDNTHAIRFYQKFGFALKTVHIGSFEAVRRLKPWVPMNGIDGIPLAHEFEFEYFVGCTARNSA